MSALQQPKQQELNLHLESGRNPDCSSEAFVASHLSESPTGQIRLMESILERENMNRAYRQVVSNKGAAGIDAMTVGQLRGYLDHHWTKIEAILRTFLRAEPAHPCNDAFERLGSGGWHKGKRARHARA